jgi:hypothetical protein
MSVNIFSGSPEDVEAEVRSFLELISPASIYKILQSESSSAHGTRSLTITVFYVR